MISLMLMVRTVLLLLIWLMPVQQAIPNGQQIVIGESSVFLVDVDSREILQSWTSHIPNGMGTPAENDHPMVIVNPDTNQASLLGNDGETIRTWDRRLHFNRGAQPTSERLNLVIDQEANRASLVTDEGEVITSWQPRLNFARGR